jgi:TonB-dependent SusC/RagA subfamily outer membrane receptor
MKSIHHIPEKMFLKKTLIVVFGLLLLQNVSAFSFSKEKNNKHTLTVATAPKIKIQGKVIDSLTQEVIPYSTIQITNSFVGTSSNELGEFEIVASELPIEITISHISYNTQTITITEQTTELVIQLTPAITVLDEIVLTTNEDQSYAIGLAKKAYKKLKRSDSKYRFGKAFYRQKSKNSDEYSELSEIIYDVLYNSSGIVEWDILEGRYALKEQYINNKNFSTLSYTLKSIQPDTEDAYFPLREDFTSLYDVEIIEVFEQDKDRIAVIEFTPKEIELATPIFSGEAFINTKTGDLLKITGTVQDDRLDIILLKDEEASKKNYQLRYEMVYKKGSSNTLLLDYINIEQEFDYYQGDVLETHISSTSNLTFFEHYQPKSTKRLGGKSRGGTSDWEQLNTIGYNQEFWENNPIVKRTPVEKEVIAAFEKKNSFEPIFLNSQKQIVAIQSKISEDIFIKELDSVSEIYKNKKPIEKVYLHLDKAEALPGANIWFSGYVTFGGWHQYSTKSGMMHLDLVDANNELVLSQKKLLFDGKANGNLTLPRKLPQGTYELRAYTDRMQTLDQDFIFTKEIEVGYAQDTIAAVTNVNDIDLQFFPEGGNMVTNLAGKVAFKATDKEGYDIPLKGKIFDSEGNFIKSFQTKEKGMGVLSLKPISNATYVAVTENGAKYPLPKALSSGYSMIVNNIDDRSVKVKIQASPDLLEQDFYLVGHVMNEKYYQGRFNFGGRPFINIEIPKNRLPSGILTLTLFDQNRKPWCERIAFVNNQDDLNIITSIDTKSDKKDGKVRVNVLVTDAQGKPISTNFSMAITNTERLLKNSNASNILTYLLLESDIKGTIENPGQFFRNKDRTTKYRLDLVMMTHGWRRFQWQQMQNLNELPTFVEAPNGMTISGVATKINGRTPLVNTRLDLIAKSKEGFNMYKSRTNELGEFTFNNLVFNDSIKVVMNAYSETNREMDFRATLNKTSYTFDRLPKFSRTFIDSEKKTVETTNVKASEYKRILETSNQPDTISMIRKGIVLDEVKVTNSKRFKRQPSRMGVEPDAVVIPDENQPFLNQLASVAGVTVAGNVEPGTGNPAKISVRGSAPLFILDGMPFPSDTSIPGASAATGFNGSPSLRREGLIPAPILYLKSREIERVEILKDGASTAQYGVRGAGGVIIIYTKIGEYRPINTRIPEFDLVGFRSEREFYIPKYEIKASEKQQTNLISTLYWNPSLVTDQNGLTSIVFDSKENLENIQIAIEALSEFGVPGAILKTVSLKE